VRVRRWLIRGRLVWKPAGVARVQIMVLAEPSLNHSTVVLSVPEPCSSTGGFSGHHTSCAHRSGTPIRCDLVVACSGDDGVGAGNDSAQVQR
jgi:hypothetical protein